MRAMHVIKGTIFLLCFCLMMVQAQDSARVEPPAPAVTSVFNYASKGDVVKIGDYVGIRVKNLESLYTEDDEEPSPVLYLQNVPMRGVKPTVVDLKNDLVVFQIVRNDSTKAVWDIFYKPSERNEGKPFTVSIGKDYSGAIKGKPGIIKVQLYSKLWLRIMLGVYILILTGFVFLAIRTTLIRDGIVPVTRELATFSLAKTQLALWTLLIIGSVGYIFSVTGELPVLTGSTWILLAISIGTTAGAQIINISHKGSPKRKSDQFFADLLSDKDGVNIHRFQMAVWTVFLSIYFINKVYNNLDIPQLSNDLLALMGISSGTYLGLKIPEDKEEKPGDNA